MSDNSTDTKYSSANVERRQIPHDALLFGSKLRRNFVVGFSSILVHFRLKTGKLTFLNYTLYG